VIAKKKSLVRILLKELLKNQQLLRKRPVPLRKRGMARKRLRKVRHAKFGF
jgi:hypothetical protein